MVREQTDEPNSHEVCVVDVYILPLTDIVVLLHPADVDLEVDHIESEGGQQGQDDQGLR